MKKTVLKRLAMVIPLILIALFVISACDSPEPRILVSHYWTPGGPFSTNVNDDDPRRRIRCTIVFEVVDEAAIAELEEVVFKVRSSVLAVLGELTIPEITTQRDFDDISYRLIERINDDLPTDYDLFKHAYFTDFILE